MTENPEQQIADAAADNVQPQAPQQPITRAMVMKQMCERIRLDEGKSDSKRLAHLIEVLTCEIANQTEIAEQQLRISIGILQALRPMQQQEGAGGVGLFVPEWINAEGKG